MRTHGIRPIAIIGVLVVVVGALAACGNDDEGGEATGDGGTDSVGLANVDERLRSAFGDDYGLVVETAPGAGTRVIVRVPKYAPGVHQ